MANTGYKRSLTVEVTKYTNGEVTSGYPLIYNGLNSFTVGGVTYTTITETELQNMSEVDYNTRLAAFKNYVAFREHIDDFDTTIQAGYEPVILDEDTCGSMPSEVKFSDLFRSAYIRNTALDNWNITVESRFKVIDTDTNEITLDHDVPELVISGAEAGTPPTNQGWFVATDKDDVALIESIDVTKRILTLSATYANGRFNLNNKVNFINPFMNYQVSDFSDLLALGAAASWNELGVLPGGVWTKEDGTYAMAVLGLSSIGHAVPPDPQLAAYQVKMGLATSADGSTWAYENSGAYLYKANVGDFNLTVCQKGVYSYGNPVLIDQTPGSYEYLQFAVMVNSTSRIGIGWYKHDEDFNITQVCSDFLSFSTFDIENTTPKYVTGAVYFDGAYRIYFVEHVTEGTPSTWKLWEAKVNIETMSVTAMSVVMTCSQQDRFEGKEIDLAYPIVFNNELYLLVLATAKSGQSFSVITGTRTIGLLKYDGSWITNTLSPVILPPLASTSDWNATLDISNANSNLEKGCGFFFGATELNLYLSTRGSGDAYAHMQHLVIPLTPTE